MDITKLRSGAHNKEDIVLAGVLHDKRCLEAADEIERLRKLWQDAVDDKHAWTARERRAEREVCATLAEEPPPIGGPTHGAWDRGYLDGRKAAAAAIRARK